MFGENCLILTGIFQGSFWDLIFRVPTKDDEYSINWRNNIVTVITCVVIPDMVMKAI